MRRAVFGATCMATHAHGRAPYVPSGRPQRVCRVRRNGRDRVVVLSEGYGVPEQEHLRYARY